MAKRVKSKEFLSGSDDDSDSDNVAEEKVEKSAKKAKKESAAEEKNVWELGKKKKITISEYRGQKYVNIREYYLDNGVEKPGRKGIALNRAQWEEFMKITDEVSQKFLK